MDYLYFSLSLFKAKEDNNNNNALKFVAFNPIRKYAVRLQRTHLILKKKK